MFGPAISSPSHAIKSEGWSFDSLRSLRIFDVK
jgi:hypothetical protein